MSSTIQFLRRVIIVLLILNCLAPVLVLGQDETTPAPDPDPTTRAPPEPTTRQPDPTTRQPDPTTRQPDPTTREPPTTRPAPTTRDDPPTSRQDPTTLPDPTTRPPATTDGNTSTDPPTSDTLTPTQTSITDTTTSFSISTSTTGTAMPPVTTDPSCPQSCLTTAAADVGCTSAADRNCICPKLESFLGSASSCMRTKNCDPSLSSTAIQNQRAECITSVPPTSSSTTISEPSTPPGPRPTSTPPTTRPPGPTVGTAGGTGAGGQLTTQTQTLVLTAGQVVTLGVSGTVQTTFTASSALTTTRIATMLEQAGSGGFGGDGTAGNGDLALRVGASAVFGLGVMLGAMMIM